MRTHRHRHKLICLLPLALPALAVQAQAQVAQSAPDLRQILERLDRLERGSLNR